MSTQEIIRYWKDPEYRESLSGEQEEQLPASPAGLVELEDADLDLVAVGIGMCKDAPALFSQCRGSYY